MLWGRAASDRSSGILPAIPYSKKAAPGQRANARRLRQLSCHSASIRFDIAI